MIKTKLDYYVHNKIVIWICSIEWIICTANEDRALNWSTKIQIKILKSIDDKIDLKLNNDTTIVLIDFWSLTYWNKNFR